MTLEVMGERETPLAASVENDLNKARDSLRQLDDELRQLTGRGANEMGGNRFGRGRTSGRFSMDDVPSRFGGGGLGNGSGGYRTVVDAGLTTGGIGQKRRITSQGYSDNGSGEQSWKRSRVVADSFDPDAPTAKPVVQSSVTMPQKETKSRDAAISELKVGERREVAVRNRRMFGVLLGTLKKFKKEEEKHTFKDQERKQREIEIRLEEEKKEERTRIEKERRTLLEKRRRQENDVRRLQRKRALIAATDNQVALLKRLQNFIQTTTKPPIFFMPSRHTIRTIELQKKSQKRLEESIKAKQEETELELKRMDEGLVVPMDEDDEQEHEQQQEQDPNQEKDDLQTEANKEATDSAMDAEGAGDQDQDREQAPPPTPPPPPAPKDIQEELKELTAGYHAEDLNFEEDEQQQR